MSKKNARYMWKYEYNGDIITGDGPYFKVNRPIREQWEVHDVRLRFWPWITFSSNYNFDLNIFHA
jgi:hypothetical protein